MRGSYPFNYIVIGGPTASGKTTFAAALAGEMGGEVVSADSMQIYRGIPISTAQPTVEEMRGIPHHMIAVAELTESWSAQLYRDRARIIIEEIRGRGRLPILVGGTGFWREAVMFDMDMTDAGRDDDLRRELAEFAAEHGNEALYERLRGLDPIRAAELHPNDVHRVIRAIEVCTLTGSTMSGMKQGGYSLWGQPYRISLEPQRDVLYDRINRRVGVMLQCGLVEEARYMYGLAQSGVLTKGATALSGIGCKELFPYFGGECSLDEALEVLKRRTRNYAKRQLTWQRHENTDLLIDPQAFSSAEELAQEVINRFGH